MFAGTVAVYGALQLVLAFSISALYSPVDAGVYFLALAIVTPSALFVGFRLRDDLLVNADENVWLYVAARAFGLVVLSRASGVCPQRAGRTLRCASGFSPQIAN